MKKRKKDDTAVQHSTSGSNRSLENEMSSASPEAPVYGPLGDVGGDIDTLDAFGHYESPTSALGNCKHFILCSFVLFLKYCLFSFCYSTADGDASQLRESNTPIIYDTGI